MTALAEQHNAPSPWRWVPSAYFFQALPYAIVTVVTTVFFKALMSSADAATLAHSYLSVNSMVALLSSLLMLPWVLKPFCAVYLEGVADQRRVVLLCQGLMALTLLVLLVSIFSHWIVIASFFSFLLLGVWSTLHDISVDGLYLSNLPTEQQVRFVGVRSFFYQLARLLVQSGVISLLDLLSGLGVLLAWQCGFAMLATLMAGLVLYHIYYLPHTVSDLSQQYAPYVDRLGQLAQSILGRSRAWQIILFIFIYNMVEGQLLRVVPLYLLDPITQGGLAYSYARLGLYFGGLGSLSTMLGISISGLCLTRFGLRQCFIPLTMSIVLANSLFLFLSLGLLPVSLCPVVLMLSQLSFGLGNSAYMAYLLHCSRSVESYAMSAYAVATAVMAAGFLFFGAISGSIQSLLGYPLFFFWIIVCSLFALSFTVWICQTHDIN